MSINTVSELYEAFNKAAVAPMREDLSKPFISVLMAELHCEKDPTMFATVKARVEESPTPIIQIALARMQRAAPNVTWSPLFMILIDVLSEGSPGNAVMWAAYAVGLVQKGKAATVQSMAEQFPVGFPTSDALHEIWDAQKFEGNNMVDALSFWA